MARRSRIRMDEDDTELNMTPMLDVVFILLIFFIDPEPRHKIIMKMRLEFLEANSQLNPLVRQVSQSK